MYISTLYDQFKDLRQKEVNRLITQGVFKLIHKDDLLDSVRLFTSRFVNKVKNKGTDKAYKKSRLVI
jgi:hypothetical protein